MSTAWTTTTFTVSVYPELNTGEADIASEPTNVNIAKHAVSNKGNFRKKYHRRWWLDDKYSINGKGYNQLAESILAVATTPTSKDSNDETFNIRRIKRTPENRVEFYCCDTVQDGSKCTAKFSVYYCSSKNRCYLPMAGPYCWSHTCLKATNDINSSNNVAPPSAKRSRPSTYNERKPLSDDVKMTLNRRFVASHNTISVDRVHREKLTYLSVSRHKIWKEITSSGDGSNGNSTVSRHLVDGYLASLHNCAATYCPHNEALSEVGGELKTLLDKMRQKNELKLADKRGSRSGESFINDFKTRIPSHLHHKYYVHSGDQASIKGFDKNSTIANLTDGVYGNPLSGSNNLDDDIGKNFWNVMHDIGHSEAKAGSYHVGVQSDEISNYVTTYLPHCDTQHFAYVLFLILHGITYAVVAVPKGSKVPLHSNKDFKEWRDTLPEHSQDKKVMTREDVDDFMGKFRKRAFDEMKRKPLNQGLNDVDVYCFKLVLGGYVSFNATICCHTTITPGRLNNPHFDGGEGVRHMLALHAMEHQPNTKSNSN